jgi:RimJ/RimL family protein N-acetyltransferase
VLPDLPTDDDLRIATERLDLVPLTADDANDLFPLMNDPALGRFTDESPPADVDEVRRRFAGWEGRRSPDGSELWLNWAVRRREGARAVGLVQATVGEEDTSIAWTIGTAHQRQGLATEAGRALVVWLRDPLGVATIVASIHADHVASRAVAERIGFRQTDRRHDGEDVWTYVTIE